MPRSFYELDAAHVAPRLLGHWLLRRTPLGWCGGVVVETEAYLHNDPACHAYRGPTQRNRAMFGPPGLAYVYFIYGNHWCFNAVCSPPDVGEAVLLRAIEPQFGKEWMEQRRQVERPRDLTNGPAKLCAALDLDRRHDHADLCAADGEVVIARNPALEETLERLGPVVTTVRIGLSKAADLPLRFLLSGSEFISRKAPGE